MFNNVNYVPMRVIDCCNGKIYIGDQTKQLQKSMKVKPGKYKVYIKSIIGRVTDIELINIDCTIDQLDNSDWNFEIGDNINLSSNKIYIGNFEWMMIKSKKSNMNYHVESLEGGITNLELEHDICSIINVKDVPNREYQIQSLMAFGECIGLLIHLW